MNCQGPIDRDVYAKIKKLEIFLEKATDEKDKKNLRTKIVALKRKIEK